MARYKVSLSYEFKDLDSGETLNGSDAEINTYHDTYEDAVAFQSYVINPGIQVIVEGMKQAGLAVLPGNGGKVPPGQVGK